VSNRGNPRVFLLYLYPTLEEIYSEDEWRVDGHFLPSNFYPRVFLDSWYRGAGTHERAQQSIAIQYYYIIEGL
jgi:hypothetical protein